MRGSSDRELAPGEKTDAGKMFVAGKLLVGAVAAEVVVVIVVR